MPITADAARTTSKLADHAQVGEKGRRDAKGLRKGGVIQLNMTVEATCSQRLKSRADVNGCRCTRTIGGDKINNTWIHQRRTTYGLGS